MTPKSLDADVVRSRLALMLETLGELEALRGRTAEHLAARPLERAAAERLVQVMIDVAIGINAHIVAALAGRAPETGRQSFEQLGELHVIDGDRATRLAPASGLRNILVHRYGDIRLDLVAGAIETCLVEFDGYVHEIASWLERSQGQGRNQP